MEALILVLFIQRAEDSSVKVTVEERQFIIFSLSNIYVLFYFLGSIVGLTVRSQQ